MNIRFAHKHRGTKWDPIVVAKAVGLDVSEVLRITKEASFGIDPSDYEYVSAQDVRRFVERVQKYPEYRSLLCALGDFIPLDAPAKLTDFLCLHNFIDLFCWLIKLRYSDRETVKTKRFSFDGLLLNFLADRKIDLSRLRRLGGSRNSPEKMLFYLQKGWYDELWRSSFSKNEGLRLTTSIGYDFAKNASPVWNVVQSYYAHYNYLSALVFTNVDQLRTQEHQKAPKYFYKNLLTKFEQRLVCYPFSLRAPNLSEGDISRLRGPEKDFWRFKYARCSRNPNESIKPR